MTIQIISNKTPTGAINDDNTIFTAPSSFTAASTRVYVDLGRVHLGVDYTEINDTQIQFTTAPSTGETIIMDYSHDDGLSDTGIAVIPPARAAQLCNASMVRDLSILLNDNDNPTNAKITNIIRAVDSKIALMLASRYTKPPAPLSYLIGSITVYKDDKTVTGFGTTFLSDLYPGQTIQLINTGEAIRVLSIESDLSFTADSEAVNYTNGSRFWVIPEELVTASMWLSGQAAIMLYFPEKTLKQDNIEKFDQRMKIFAQPIIDELKSGDYINSYLRAQTAEQSIDRLVYVGIDNDNRERIDRNHNKFHGGNFI